MTLEEAYLRLKQENRTLQRENRQLADVVEKLQKGAYAVPEKVAHINRISELTRQLRKEESIKARYKVLYENEHEKSDRLQQEMYDLEEKVNSLQWQVDCLERKKSAQSIITLMPRATCARLLMPPIPAHRKQLRSAFPARRKPKTFPCCRSRISP